MGIKKKVKRKTIIKHERKKRAQKISKLRIALFTHDTFGLGHLRRSLHIIRTLASQLSNASLMLITGSPALPFLKDLPHNADYVKIPTIVKTGALGSQPPHLPLSVTETTLLRARIIKETVLAFEPDLFIVDNFPLGSKGELLPVLQALKPLSTKTILGLRDILDVPDVIRSDWKRQGIYDVLERYYDRILVYGAKKIFDIVEAYDLPPQTSKKVRYCGYLTEASLTVRANNIRKELGIKGPFVLVTGGGGGDAFPLLYTFVQALPQLQDISSVIITGPLMGASDRAKLQRQLNGDSKVIIRDFVPDLSLYLKTADVVVSMCGYNTAAEIMVQKPKAIVVPRTWKYGEHMERSQTSEEGEQIIRAQALSRFGFVHLIKPDNLHVDHLSRKIREVLSRPKKKPIASVNIRGLEVAVKEILKTAFSR